MSYGHCEPKVGTIGVGENAKDVFFQIGENSGMITLDIKVEDGAHQQIIFDYATFGAIAKDFADIYGYLEIILKNTIDSPRTAPFF